MKDIDRTWLPDRKHPWGLFPLADNGNVDNRRVRWFRTQSDANAYVDMREVQNYSIGKICRIRYD